MLLMEGSQLLRALTIQHALTAVPEERFNRVARLAGRALNVCLSYVILPDRGRPCLKATHGFTPTDPDRWIAFTQAVLGGRTQAVIADLRREPLCANHGFVLSDPYLRFFAAQAICGPDGSIVGALCIADREADRLRPHDLPIFADLAAIADREISMLESATTDELTRLSNRRGFTLMGEHALALCRRNQQCATVIGIDLDRFKSINDNFGHAAGDAVLKTFAKLLVQRFRTADVVARVGGDEFAVLCSGATADSMKATISRLARDFSSSSLAHDYPELSWSAGVEDFNWKNSATLDDLMRASDRRMYRSKVSKRRLPAVTQSAVASNG